MNHDKGAYRIFQKHYSFGLPLLFVKNFGRLKEGEGGYRTAFSRPSRGGRVSYRNLEEEVGMKLPRAGFAPFGASPFC
jgi:hypothetical protein